MKESDSSIEDDFNTSVMAIASLSSGKDEKSGFSHVLEQVLLPWRDNTPIQPHHINLAREESSGLGPMLTMEDGTVSEEYPNSQTVMAVEADRSMVEKLMRFLPSKATDMVIPLDVYVRSITGEKFLLKIPATPFADIPKAIKDKIQEQVSDSSKLKTKISLDRIVQHMHIRPTFEEFHSSHQSAQKSPRDERKDENQEDDSGTRNSTPNLLRSSPGNGSMGSLGNNNNTSNNNSSNSNSNNNNNANSSNTAAGANPTSSTSSNNNGPVTVTANPSDGPSNHLLSRVPIGISQCKRMTSFGIENQSLVSIDEILLSDGLEELRIVNCDLKEVPASLLSKLPRLKVLDLHGNVLTSLSLSISGRVQLEVLRISQNQLTNVPTCIAKLKSLTDLDLSYNKLSSLPPDLKQLFKLGKFNMEGNNLVTPSVALIRGVLGSIDVVTRFPSLTALNLSRNKVTDVPSAIDKLGSLIELNLADNRLSKINMELSLIPTLQVLDVSGNTLGPVAPKELVLLKNLKVLKLSRNGLKSLPEKLGWLHQLQELDISRNRIQKVERDFFTGMMSLKALDCSRNVLENVDFLLELAGLVRLDLSFNALSVLPDEINVLEKLTWLNICNNKLTVLPESFQQLYNLEYVDFSANTLESLDAYWNSGSFPKLKFLSLSGNPRAAVSLHFSFSTLSTLQSISLLGIAVDIENLYIQNPARFDLSLFIEVAAKVRHPLLFAAFFGVASVSTYHETIVKEGVELMLSLCDMRAQRSNELKVHENWPPRDMFDSDTARYLSLITMTKLTHKMDANGPRWQIYLHGAPQILMDVINKHPDVRFKLLCIRLLGNLALHRTVKSQIFHEKSEVVAYLEDLALTSRSDSIKRFCNRTFAIFGICQHFHTSLVNAFLGKHKGVRILSLDGGGTRSLVTVAILAKIRDMTGKRIEDMFDLIVGTSAGGLIALAFLSGKTLEEMADMYLNRGHLCFSPQDEVSEAQIIPAWNRTVRPMLNLATKGAMYRCKTYEKELKKFYGHGTMISTAEDELNPKVAVLSTLTSVKPAVPYLCRNYDYPPHRVSRYDGDLTWRLWEVARATSAAPSFFDPFEREENQYMDGGIVGNNPSAVALHEAQKIWGVDVPISLFLSLGTGMPSPTAAPKDRGFMDTLEQLVDAALSQERVHEMLMDTVGPRGIPYYRLNPQGPAFGTRLDEIRKPELLKLQAAAQEWIEEHDETFRMIKGIILEKQLDNKAKVIWHDESTDDTRFMNDISAEDDELNFE